MNWWGYAIVCFAIIFFAVHWCSSDKKEELYNHPIVSEDLSTNYSNDSLDNDYDHVEYTECIKPENPYDEYNEEWHYVGFERAEETGWSCNGNSDSFNEWCETYYELEEKYNECINKIIFN